MSQMNNCCISSCPFLPAALLTLTLRPGSSLRIELQLVDMGEQHMLLSSSDNCHV